MKRLALTLTTLFALTTLAQNHVMSDVADMTIPNAVKYLPGPPDSLSQAFAHDVRQYMYGKSLRDTDRGAKALEDVTYSTIYVASKMSDVFGVEVNYSQTPQIMELLNTAINYISSSCGAAKTYYNRRRPFDRFGDPLFSPENASSLKRQGAYPSSHSMMGWGVALVLSELNPDVQDDLLEQGYEYGESRTIVGAHWQSDVDAARMMTAAGFARLHSSPSYLAQLSLAQAEYDQLTQHRRKTDFDGKHPHVRFLPAPPDSASALFGHDVVSHYATKTLRNQERGEQAVLDADASTAGVAQAFSPVLGITIDATTTPAIWQLLDQGLSLVSSNCTTVKSENWRERPFVQLRTSHSSIEAIDALSQESSYPSRHAAIGWCASLMLANVCPSYQNNILLRGREYGQSRVIVGTNWQSDVDAGQLLGGMIFANLVSDESFCHLLTQARAEFNQVSESPVIHADEATKSTSIRFTLDGRVATASSRGIVVSSDGQKFIH